MSVPAAATSRTHAGWVDVAFSDVVRQVKTSVEPASSGLTRYVAGEHMDTDDLRIRRWGRIGDGYLGPAFHRRFETGQILYGSRRTYLRKVAVAPFDGICANTTFVCEPADDRLLPEFLPFVMQTEAFHRHSIANSKGSVNPYVNWRDIASHRFALPPVDAQRRIARILTHALEVAYRWEATAASCAVMEQVAFEEWLQRVDASDWIRLGDLLTEVKYGTSVKCGEPASGAIPVLRIPNVVNEMLDLTDLKWAPLSPAEVASYAVKPGDLLIVRTNGNPDYVGRCSQVVELDGEYAFASYLLRLRVVEELLLPQYLWLLLRQPRIRRTMTYLARSSAGNYNLSAQGLADLRLPIPGLVSQDAVARRANEIVRRQEAAHAQTERSVALAVALREDLLDAGRGDSVH